MAEEIKYPFAQFTAEEFDKTVDIFRRDGIDPERGIAQMLANSLSKDYPDNPEFITYDGLKNGTAPVFDLFPKFSAMSPTDRKQTDAGILQMFAYDMDGRPVQPGTVKEGFKRKIGAGGASAAAFLAAAKTTNAINQLNPLTAVPVTAPQAAYRILSPLAAGTVAAIKAGSAADSFTREILGDAPLILPSTKGRQVFGEVLAENAFFGLIPYGVSKNVSLSGLKMTEVFTPVKFGKKGLIFGGKRYKPTLGYRMTRGAENLLNRMSQEAYNRPITYLGAEAAATGMSAVLAKGAEEAAPGQLGPRMTAEVVGGVLGGVGGDLALKRTVDIFQYMKGFYKTAREDGLQGALQKRQTKKQAEISNFLIDYIEKYGGDVDEIINNLTDVKMKDALQEYARKTGKTIDLTAGVASRSPLILALEKQLELVTPGLANQRGIANKDAVEAFRMALLAAHSTGDTEMVRLASAQMKDLFEIGLQTTLDSRLLNLRDAVKRLSSGDAEADPVRMSELGNQIFDGVLNSLKLDRAKERYLWKNVPSTITINRFVDADGNETNVPNFLQMWNEAVPAGAAPEAFDDTLSELSSLVKFADRKRTELGLGGSISAPAVPQNISKFRSMYGDLEGTDTRKYFDKMVEQFNLNDPTTASIEKLAQLSSQSRGRRRSGTELSKLYDAKRRALVSQKDALPPPTAVQELSSELPAEVVSDFNLLLKNASEGNIANKTLDIDDPDALIKEAEGMEAFATQQRQAELFPEADRFQQQAQLLRARAQDLVEGPKPALDAVDGDPVGAVTIGELTSMRSQALSLAKQAAARGDAQTENLANSFASAIEMDIESFPQGEVLAYDIARSFSRALNDTYTRSFAGKVLERTKTGAQRITPEEIGRQLFASHGGYERAKQLDNIGKFQLTASLSEMLGSADGGALLDSAKKASFNEETGFFDLNSLQAWVQQNKDELAELPGVKLRQGPKGRMIASEGGSLLDNVNQTVASSLSLRGTQENILRIIKSEAFDPQAPEQVSATSLRKWMEKSENKALLDVFPAIRMDLEDIVSGDNSKLILFNNQKRINKDALDEERALLSAYSFLDPKGAESPATVISKYIGSGSGNPIRALDKFWDRLSNAPKTWKNEATGQEYSLDDAKEGFKSAILDAVFINSGASTGSTNARNAYMFLFSPNQKAQGKVSLADWAVGKGVFTEGEMKDIEDFVGKMVEFEGTIFQGSAADVDSLVSKMGPSAELVVSVLGSSAGTRLQKLISPDSGTATIIAAGRGAEAFRTGYKNVFKDLPNAFRIDLLKEIIKDPEALAMALKEGKTAKEKSRILSYFKEWLVDKGLVAPARRALPGVATPDDQPVSEDFNAPDSLSLQERTEDVQRRAQELINQQSSLQLPTPPAAQPTTALASAAPVQPQPVAPPPVASGPVDRSRYAALFPNDVASGMIRQNQGIGSLMG